MTDYGTAKDCEVEPCDGVRGAPLRSIRSYGCVLCPWHESRYQLGQIDLPESASEERAAEAAEQLYG